MLKRAGSWLKADGLVFVQSACRSQQSEVDKVTTTNAHKVGSCLAVCLLLCPTKISLHRCCSFNPKYNLAPSSLLSAMCFCHVHLLAVAAQELYIGFAIPLTTMTVPFVVACFQNP